MADFFVTGSSGFLGREFVRQLLESGREVVAGDRIPASPAVSGCEFIEFDLISNVRAVAKSRSASEASTLIHCAAISDLYEAQQSLKNTLESNFVGTQKLATLFLDSHGDNPEAIFVYASSIYAVENAMNFYGLSKYLSEQYLNTIFRNSNAKCMIVKFGSLYGHDSGPNNGIRKMIESAIFDGRVTYSGYPDAVRDYLYVDDAVSLTLNEISRLRKVKASICSMTMTGGYPRRVKDVADLITRICKCVNDPLFEAVENSLNYREGCPSLIGPTHKYVAPDVLDELEHRLIEIVRRYKNRGS